MLDDQVPADSPRGRFRKRREEILDDLWIDLRVPRWSKPEVWVRYRPAKLSKIEGASIARKKSGAEDWLVLANADVLIDCCVAIFELPEGALPAEEASKEKPDRLAHATFRWESFGPELAKEFVDEGETPPSKATDVLRLLFLADGDVMQHSTMLSGWSNTASLKAEELVEGESQATQP